MIAGCGAARIAIVTRLIGNSLVLPVDVSPGANLRPMAQVA
jgi:hypothetical protein